MEGDGAVRYLALNGVYITPKKLKIEFYLTFDRDWEDHCVELEEILPSNHHGGSVGYHENAGLYIMLFRRIHQISIKYNDRMFENRVMGYIARECGYKRTDYNKLGRLKTVLDKTPNFVIKHEDLMIVSNYFMFIMCLF